MWVNGATTSQKFSILAAMELSNCKRWFTLSYDEFIAENKIDISQVHEDVRYEKITGVVRVDLSNERYFFFKDGTLKLIYISNDVVIERLWRAFKNSLDNNTPEKTVRSRAGKTSNQLIFASQGITASLKDTSVDFIEIYPPCSLQDYLDNVYSEPGLFIR
jgi:hypothetical protein